MTLKSTSEESTSQGGEDYNYDMFTQSTSKAVDSVHTMKPTTTKARTIAALYFDYTTMLTLHPAATSTAHPSTSTSITSVIVGASAAIGVLLLLIIIFLCILILVIFKRKGKTVIQLSNVGAEPNTTNMDNTWLSRSQNHTLNQSHSSDGYMNRHLAAQTNSLPQYLLPTEWRNTEEILSEKERVPNPFYASLNECETTMEDPPKYEAISEMDAQNMNLDLHGQVIWTQSTGTNEKYTPQHSSNQTPPPPIPPRTAAANILEIENHRTSMRSDNENVADTGDEPHQITSGYSLLGEYLGSMTSVASYLVLERASSKESFTEENIVSGGHDDECGSPVDGGTVEAMQHSEVQNTKEDKTLIFSANHQLMCAASHHENNYVEDDREGEVESAKGERNLLSDPQYALPKDAALLVDVPSGEESCQNSITK